jgi:hypothetical protein
MAVSHSILGHVDLHEIREEWLEEVYTHGKLIYDPLYNADHIVHVGSERGLLRDNSKHVAGTACHFDRVSGGIYEYI